jgi:hypothetical protein
MYGELLLKKAAIYGKETFDLKSHKDINLLGYKIREKCIKINTVNVKNFNWNVLFIFYSGFYHFDKIRSEPSALMKISLQ